MDDLDYDLWVLEQAVARLEERLNKLYK